MSTTVRTRYAPSPTGFQHIGGIRTALFCYLFTKKMGGKMVLRIEDTDRSRYVEGAEQYIIDALNWCGIEVDEGVHVGGGYGPYRQSDRKALYQENVQKLLDKGEAYYAFDTPEELDALREELEKSKAASRQYGVSTRMRMKNSLTLSAAETQALLDEGVPYVVRIKIPEDEIITIHDVVHGAVQVESNLLDDKILMKGDGMPTYHLANVVDDHYMKITHVIRGDEWLPSTPLHAVLYKAFGWQDTMPKFAHLPLILKPTGKGKLSKRAADQLGFSVFPLAWQHPTTDESSSGFAEDGFLPEAFINMLAFLGWNPGNEQEIFSMQELIDIFSLDRIQKAGAKFNFDKAKWFNEQHLRAKTDAALAILVQSVAPEKYADVDAEVLQKAVVMMRDRLTFAKDFWDNAVYFFEKPADYDAKVVRKKWKAERKPLFAILRNRLEMLEEFGAAEIEKTVKEFIEETKLGFGNVLQIFRVMLAGTMAGPDIFEMAAILGQTEVVDRMNVAAEKMDEMTAS